MEDHRIAVSPSLIIALHPPPHPREPRKPVGWVPGARNRVLLTRSNALILAELSSGRTRWDRGCEAAPDAAAWDAAVKSLVRSGRCVEGGAERGWPPPLDREFERRDGDVGPISRPVPSRLHLPWNFAMRPG